MNENCSINLFMGSILISTRKYTYDEFKPFFHGPVNVALTKDSERNINRSHKHLVSNLKSGKPIYGVNTGFGNLSNISICEEGS